MGALSDWWGAGADRIHLELPCGSGTCGRAEKGGGAEKKASEEGREEDEEDTWNNTADEAMSS